MTLLRLINTLAYLLMVYEHLPTEPARMLADDCKGRTYVITVLAVLPVPLYDAECDDSLLSCHYIVIDILL